MQEVKVIPGAVPSPIKILADDSDQLTHALNLRVCRMLSDYFAEKLPECKLRENIQLGEFADEFNDPKTVASRFPHRIVLVCIKLMCALAVIAGHGGDFDFNGFCDSYHCILTSQPRSTLS
jgi:hypothetical protein